MSVLYLTLVTPPLACTARRRTASSDFEKQENSHNSIKPVDGYEGNIRLREAPFAERYITKQDELSEARSFVDAGTNAIHLTRVKRDTREWEILRSCAEVISLYRVRDAMGRGLEPMMGWLRLVNLRCEIMR